jgi:hypothetical protein
MDLNKNKEKKREKIAEIKNKYAGIKGCHTLLFSGGIYRETSDALYRSTTLSVDRAAGYLIRKNVVFYIFWDAYNSISRILVQ